ncbi:hypothetical protein Tsubulata_042529 [Turnera subulata]|uniref:RING-type domain-containing protein n=1 Tax=Turnera subulata TaxID=218843 RepID=A0A9Q0J1E3_9ROSI|nr:hypothetical protein Tsubulata_042529 [Turnera subulata]
MDPLNIALMLVILIFGLLFVGCMRVHGRFKQRGIEPEAHEEDMELGIQQQEAQEVRGDMELGQYPTTTASIPQADTETEQQAQAEEEDIDQRLGGRQHPTTTTDPATTETITLTDTAATLNHTTTPPYRRDPYPYFFRRPRRILSPNLFRPAWQVYVYSSSASEETIISNSSSGCAICFVDFKDGDSCKVLSGCSHMYHLKCINRWLVKKTRCPLCRVSVRGYNRAYSSVLAL